MKPIIAYLKRPKFARKHVRNWRPSLRKWTLLLGAAGLLLPASVSLGADRGASAQRGSEPRRDASRRQAKPNVVIILADDLGWPDVSSYGRRDVPTPNLDRIARTGVAFSSGYVAASVCAVSRAGLLTGRMPQSFGFTYNINDAGDIGAGLPATVPTLAERLRPLGYRSAAIGKWHVGAEPQHYPTARGFDEFFGFLAGETPYVDPKTPGFVTTPTKADAGKKNVAARSGNTYIIEGPDRRLVHNFDRYLTDEITDRTIDFIDRNAGEPFFAYVAYNAPHWPLQVSQRWYDRFPEIKDPVRRTYVAMIASMDEGIGRILDRLEERGLRRNTIVIFLSDNGCPVQFGFCNDAHPWGAGKFTYLEGGIRVPFLMSWPGRLTPQGIVDRPVSSIDIVPTVLRAAAPMVSLPAELDGEDLLTAATKRRKTPRLLVWGQEPVFAARYGSLKYWRSNEWDLGYLYDLKRDPWERHDISAQHRAERDRLHAAMEHWRQALPLPMWKLHATREVTIGGRRTQLVY